MSVSAAGMSSVSQPTTPLHPGGLGSRPGTAEGDGNASLDYMSAPVHAGLSPSLWATPGRGPSTHLTGCELLCSRASCAFELTPI